MNREFLPTLRSRVQAVALGAVLPYLAFIAAIGYQWRAHEIEDSEHTTLALARQVVTTHHRRVAQSVDFMSAIGGIVPEAPGGGQPFAQVSGPAPGPGEEDGALALFSIDGRLLFGDGGRYGAVTEHPAFAEALRTRRVAADPYRVDPATGVAFAVLAYPLVDPAGGGVRVVMMRVGFRWLEDLFAEGLLPEHSTIVVLDERGTILAEYPRAAARAVPTRDGGPFVEAALGVADENTLQAAGLDGVDRIFAFKRFRNDVASGSLRVAVGLPSRTATTQVDAILRTDIAGLGVIITLAFVIASAGSNRFVVSPARALVTAAGRLGLGDLRVRVGGIHGPAELAQLGAAFDRMAEALEARARDSEAQRARVAMEQRRFRSLIENSEDGILLRDPAGRVLYASPSTERILGYAAADLLGRNVTDFVHPEDQPHLNVRIDHLLETPSASVTMQVRMRRKDGHWRWIELDMRNLLEDPAVGALVMNYHDSTEYREAQEQLRAARDGLELRVRQRTAELIKLNESLRTQILERHRAEEAAHASEARFRLLLDSAAEGIIGIDEAGRCTFSNSAALRLLGFTDDSRLIGTNLHHVIHGSRPDGSVYPEDECIVRSVLETVDGTHVDTEVFWRADGTSFPVEYWSHPLHLNGRPIGVVLSFLDITERRRAEESLRQLSRAIEQTADSVFVTSRDGVIEYVNPAFERLTGYSRDEAIGQKPKLFGSGVHPPEFFATLWRTVLSGKVFRTVVTNRTKDGVLFNEDQTITPIRDASGAITHFVSTGRDITARKRTEQAVRRLNTLLEQETTRIANLLHDEAGQFLTSAHLLIADVARDLPPGQRERLQSVRRSLDQVEEQLRTVSRDLHPRILQDLGLLETVRVQSAAFSRRTGITVIMDASTEFKCAPTVEVVLYRLVQEALNNIARHSKANSATIRFAADEYSVSCTIADDGQGFEPVPGLGEVGSRSLGLRGMRDRVEALGGTLRVVSAPGRGTEIRAVITTEAVYAGADTVGG